MERVIIEVETAIEFLAEELDFMVNELGLTDGFPWAETDKLDNRWAERMLKLKWPDLTDNDIAYLINAIGWH